MKELMIEDAAGYREMMRMNHGNFFYTLGTARAWAQHVEHCCALDFVEPHMDDRETKEILSRVERKD